MNLVRIAVLFVIVLSLNLLMAHSSDISMSDANHSIKRTTDLRGTLPGAYKVHMFFSDDNHEHSHTLNNGDYTINIDITGPIDFLSTGEISQVHCDLKCSIYSEDLRLTGDIDIQRTMTALTDSDESEVKNEFRSDIIKILLKEIQKI